jgi:citrate lyase subunit beta/citryl-CoA lyase
MTHPSFALFQGQKPPCSLSACDHYAGSERRMQKALSLQEKYGPIFDITFDCEDGAAIGNEIEHAQLVGRLINSESNQFNRIGARTHDVRHPAFEADLIHIGNKAAEKLAYLVIPKINGLDDAQYAIARVAHHTNTVNRQKIPIHFVIETYGAIRDAFKIAALPEVECLSFGIMDFVSEHHGIIEGAAMHSPLQFSHPLIVRAKVEIAAACHAHGKVASHNVTTEIDDINVVSQDASRALQEFGYTRMWSIHPKQIQPIIKSMSPTHDEIMKAAQIITLAQKASWGPIRYEGTLYDRASYRHYWTLLKKAKSNHISLPSSIIDLLRQ